MATLAVRRSKPLIAESLKQHLKKAFLKSVDGNISMDFTMTNILITESSSEGTPRLVELNFDTVGADKDKFKTLNLFSDINKVTNFFIVGSRGANQFVFLDSDDKVRGYITFTAIQPPASTSVFYTSVEIEVL